MFKKKWFAISLVVTISLVMAACGVTTPEPAAEEATAEEPAVLVVSEWGYNVEGIAEVFTKPMEEMYNVKIVYETGTNADRLSKLESRGAESDVDVIHLTEMFALRAAQMGLLQKLDMSRLENLDELYDWAKNPDGEGYCVSNSVNSYPLLYRTDKVDPPPTSWRDLLREDLAGKVLMTDITTTFGPSQIVMMALVNGGDIHDYEKGWELLPQWVENSLTITTGYELPALVQEGEIWMAPYASYMVGALRAIDLPLEILIPEEGVPGARNTLCIVAGTDQEDLAYKYINFLTSIEGQTAMGMAVMESPVHKAVTLPDDIGSQLTYGDEYINALVFADYSEINAMLDEWYERWNEIVVE